MIAALRGRARRRSTAARSRAKYDALCLDRDGRFLTVDDHGDVLMLRTTGTLRVDRLSAEALGRHLIEWAATQHPQ